MVSLRELQEKRALLKECEALLQVAVCPECPGVGFNVHPTMPDGEPEQVQCRWCFERDALLARVRGEI